MDVLPKRPRVYTFTPRFVSFVNQGAGVSDFKAFERINLDLNTFICLYQEYQFIVARPHLKNQIICSSIFNSFRFL